MRADRAPAGEPAGRGGAPAQPDRLRSTTETSADLALRVDPVRVLPADEEGRQPVDPSDLAARGRWPSRQLQRGLDPGRSAR